MTTWRNWSGRLEATLTETLLPADVEAVAAAVAHARGRIKVVGSGHSFSEIAVPDGALMRLDKLDRITHIDHETRLVTVEAGIPLWKLNPALAQHGLALQNLGDI